MTTQALVNLDRLKQEIAAARSIEELKEIRDRIEALRQYGKKHGWLLEDQNNAAEATIRCAYAMGKLLQVKDPVIANQFARSQGATLQDIGITKSESSRSQAISKLPEETLEQHIAEVKDKRKELTHTSTLQLVKQRELEKKKAERDAQAQVAPTKPLVTLASWETWLPQQQSCDLLITDPPYSTDVDDITSFAQSWLPLALSKVKDSGRAYVCIGAYPQELQAYLNVRVPSHLRLVNVLVWTYKNTIGPQPTHDYKQNWQAILYYIGLNAPRLNCPTMKEQFAVQEINAPDGRLGDRYHAWQKPNELAEQLIRHSTKTGDSVIDCFAGTGTFLLAAHGLGRVATGCDCSEDMLKIAEQRGCQVER